MNGIAVVISEVKLPSIRVILGRRFTTRWLLRYLFPTWDYCVSTEQFNSRKWHLKSVAGQQIGHQIRTNGGTAPRSTVLLSRAERMETV